MNFCRSILSSIKYGLAILKRLVTTILMVVSIPGMCQISVGGLPESFYLGQKKNILLPAKILRDINVDSLVKADHDLGTSNRYGVLEDLDINIREHSLKTEIPGKGYIWQYELRSETAFSIGILFKKYLLPEGASIFIYAPDRSQVLGAFTSLNNNSFDLLSIEELKNSSAVIEYFEPYDAVFPGEVVLGPVSMSYRDFFNILGDKRRIYVNCPQGEDWQVEKRSVCMITYREDDGVYYCSGFLVNNVKKDLTPYFMTANHCVHSAYSASTMISYFNYENSTCTNTDCTTSQTLSGSSLIANNSYSDFALLLMNQHPPSSYNSYLAGWDASGTSPQSGAGIHHPVATPKCISLEKDSFTLYPERLQWVSGFLSEPNTHWLVRFDSGINESGSSGSPLFDQNHKVIGQYHGGNYLGSCYGAFFLSWDQNEKHFLQLSHWLDPDSTGTTILDGMEYNTVPMVEFSAFSSTVCLNNTITLTDKSKFEPFAWKWEISPNSFQFMNGTSANSPDPDVNFNREGHYTVKLIATNQWGSDSLVKENYLEVVSKLFVELQDVADEEYICGCDLNSFPFEANGAHDYNFTFSRSDKATLQTSSDTAFLSLIHDQKKYGSFNSILKVEGKIGTCQDSDSVFLKVAMPVNDEIQNAILISPGYNGPFTNYCASGQVMEPFPGPFGCYSNSFWCPGAISGGIQNSIWFEFFGPAGGIVTIDTKGINSRIAVYQADSSQEIISSGQLSYSIIGANDDRSPLENNALLENLDVEPWKKYWLQLESFDQDTGSVSVSLITDNLEVLPNPTDGKFDAIISDYSEGMAKINIYSSTGDLVFSDALMVTAKSKRFTFDLGNYPSGLYFVRVNTAYTVYSKKILLVH